jgi:hypothetical protein
MLTLKVYVSEKRGRRLISTQLSLFKRLGISIEGDIRRRSAIYIRLESLLGSERLDPPEDLDA